MDKIEKRYRHRIRKPSIAEAVGLNPNQFDLLVDPAIQNGQAAGEKLGENLIANGEFKDFTMEDDANVVGHWIFDQKYANEKSSPIGARYAAKFDPGTNVDIPSPGTNIQFGTGNFTIDFKVLIPPASTSLIYPLRWYRGFSSASNNTGIIVALHMDRLYFQLGDGVANNGDFYISTSQYKGKYLTISLTRNSGYFEIYFNGILQGRDVDSLGSINPVSSVDVLLGSYHGSANQTLYIQEIRFSNIARSVKELDLYYKGVSPIDANVVAYYKFDDPANWLTDRSSGGVDLVNSNNGELVYGQSKNIFQDWSQGGGQLITRFEEFFTSDITDWVGQSCTISHYSNDLDNVGRINILKAVSTNTINAAPRVPMGFSMVSGTMYKISFDVYIPSINVTTDGITASLVNPSQIFLSNKTPTIDNWQTIEIYYISTSTFTDLYLYFSDGGARNTITVGDIIYLDNISVIAVTSGNHLLPASSFDWRNQMVDSASPVYKNGNTLLFDGVNDYLSIPAADATDFDFGTGDLTIEAWVKTTISGSDQHIVNRYGASSPRWYLTVSSGWIKLALVTSTGTGSIIGTINVADGSWHHVAVVIDRDVGAYLYVDGQLDVSELTTEWTNLSADDLTNSYDLEIGRNDYLSQYFNGEIAEVRISNVARTLEEIRLSYGAPKDWVMYGSFGTYNQVLQNANFQQKVTTTNNAGINIPLLCEVNKLYKITFKVTSITASGRIAYSHAGSGGVIGGDVPLGTGILYAFPTANTLAVYIRTTGSVTVEYIRVQEVLLKPATKYTPDYSKGIPKLVSSNLITGFTNGSIYAYDIFTASGTTQISVVESSADVGGMASNGFSMVAGRNYYLRFNLTLYSGTLPNVRTVTTANGRSTVSGGLDITIQAKSGLNEFYFEGEDTATRYIEISVGSAVSTNFIITDVVFYELGNASMYMGTMVGALETNPLNSPYAFPEFDGVNDAILFPYDVGKVGTNAFLIFGWFRTTGDSINIISRREGTDRWWRVVIHTTSALLRFELAGPYPTYYNYIDTGVVVNDGNWHSFALVRESDGNILRYIDGVENTYGGIINNPHDFDSVAADTKTILGAWDNALSQPFIGDLGMHAIIIFDGRNGVPSASPPNIANWVKRLHNATEWRYRNE